MIRLYVPLLLCVYLTIPSLQAQSLLIKSPERVDANLSDAITAIRIIAPLKSGNIHLADIREGTDLCKLASSIEKLPAIDYAMPDKQLLPEKALQPSQKKQRAEDRPEIQKLWKHSKGKEVNIAILDDGFDLTHPELQKTNVLFSYDADERSLDASHKAKADFHGTPVAGLIFGVHDGEGIDGIAPQANLIAIRQVSTWTSDMILAFTVAKLANADIINCSWTIPELPLPLKETLEDLIAYGREGKGTLVVASAGNKARDARTNALSQISEILIVGAKEKGYSNFGERVDVWAPTDFLAPFDGERYGNFGGTSAAAAYVSGMAGLILGADQELSLSKLSETIQFALFSASQNAIMTSQ